MCVFVLLLSIYVATYTGQSISSDEQRLVDAVHSLVKYGHMELNYTNDLRTYQTLDGSAANLSLDSEPMQVIVTAPLLWLASVIPNVGLVQAAWLLNALVTALTGMIVYFYGVTLGSSSRASLGVAMLYGLGTYAWVYSQTFFREPLFTLFALIAALSLERWRRGVEGQGVAGRAVVGWMLLAGFALLGALFTKEAGLLLVPMLLLVALPGSLTRLLDRRLIFALMVGLGVLASGVALTVWLVPSSRLASGLRQLDQIDLTYVVDAVSAYLLSPGFSVWAFSPVLVLISLGGWQRWRERRWRDLLVPLVMLAAYVFGYAVLRGGFWYGGTGWGARFLVPTIPFLCLLLLPVVENVLARHYRPPLMALVVAIVAQSVMSQVLAVTVPVRAFPNYLYGEGLELGRAEGLTPERTLVAWQEGTWHPLYLPHIVTAHQSTAPTEIAWMVNGTGYVVLPLYLAVALIALLVWRRAGLRQELWAAGLLWGVTLLMLYATLRANYTDRRFGGDNPSLWTGLAAINEQLRDGDAIILGNRTYRPFFMNYYRAAAPIYVLPNAPGEVLEIGTPPEVISTFPEERAHPYQQIMLATVARFTQRWWFVTEHTPFSEGRNRATEHYMARHYYAGSTVVNLPDLRVIAYAPISAPPETIPPWPQGRREDDFGAARLVGYDLPMGTMLTPGQVLPVSLLWRHDGWPADLEPFNYSVNVSLVDGTGAVRAQRAETPQGSFGNMLIWQKGGYYRDNVALMLPPDLPAGSYDLWVLVFDWRDNRKLPVVNADQPSQEVVVLATITVE